MEENNKIDKISNVESADLYQEENSFDFKAIITMFILNWQWFALSVFIFVCGALIYLRYTNPVYQVSAKMLIKDDNSRRGSGNQMLSNMSDMGFISTSNGIENEMEIIKSRILTRETVKELHLYVEYMEKGFVKNKLIYNTQPINVDIDPASLDKLDETMMTVDMRIKKNGNTYKVEGNTYNGTQKSAPFTTSFDKLPATLKTDAGVLTFTKNNNGKDTDKDIFVKIYPPMTVATSYAGAMSVEPISKNTSIALITIKDENPKRADNFLRQHAICYNRQANADKNEIAIKTEEFINNRLEKINKELGTTETELETYKKHNNLIQLKLDAAQTLTQANAYSDKLAEAKMQIQLLDYLREHVDRPQNKYQIIPSNVGLNDPSSTSLINSYNQAVIERNRLLRGSSEIAPQVKAITSELDNLENSIRTALLQARRTAEIQLQSIEKQYAIYNNKVANTPEQERILTQIGRQQEVKSGLYLMLLQKREENSISLAATADKGKIIDEPVFAGMVSPKKNMILMVALVLGIGLPLAIIYLIQLMRYKIEGHEDVTKLTKLPIIADVALTNDEHTNGIVVHENENNQIDEIFRSMRTNIQFMLEEGQKVVMFTSSTSGEGKTFNAVNVAVSFATLGKKVIIMGLDIRKPRLAQIFSLKDKKLGITNLLNKDHVTMDEIMTQVSPSGVNTNLDVMPAGPVPPNPTELLAREHLGDIINTLKEKYDYIILDTAPAGLVTDSLQIGKIADVAIVVCRADYTPKASFELFNKMHAERKLPNMCYVLNGVDMSKKKYGYYYGYGKYGKYGRYGRYGSYTYRTYSNSHYGNKDDKSIKL